MQRRPSHCDECGALRPLLWRLYGKMSDVLEHVCRWYWKLRDVKLEHRITVLCRPCRDAFVARRDSNLLP